MIIARLLKFLLVLLSLSVPLGELPKLVLPQHSFSSQNFVWQKLNAQNSNDTNNFQPVPYEADEFPIFWQDLRRFEVVLVGLIPVTLLFGSLLYDIVYSVSDPSIESLTIASSEDAILQKIGISISISGLLALLDMAIHLDKRQKTRENRARILDNSETISRADKPQSGTSSFEVTSSE